jgi:hypothetical protein
MNAPITAPDSLAETFREPDLSTCLPVASPRGQRTRLADPEFG